LHELGELAVEQHLCFAVAELWLRREPTRSQS
jgi:hypothetical protein